MVQQVSYVLYENFPVTTVLTLAGLNPALVLEFKKYVATQRHSAM